MWYSILVGGVTVIPVRVLVLPEVDAVMVIESGFVALPVLLIALTVKSDSPSVVGVPEIMPVVSARLKPAGKLPLSIFHVMGVSPVAASVWLYAVPTTPLGNSAVVIAGFVPPPSVVPPPSPHPASVRAVRARAAVTTAAIPAIPNGFVLFFMEKPPFSGVIFARLSKINIMPNQQLDNK
jgi:hypothetical protein